MRLVLFGCSMPNHGRWACPWARSKKKKSINKKFQLINTQTILLVIIIYLTINDNLAKLNLV